MRTDLLDSPRRLTALTLFGGLISTLGLACMGMYRGFRNLGPWLLVFGAVVFGMISVYWAAYTLREGIRNDRWPKSEVDPLRRVVEHPAWTGTIALFLVAMLAAFATRRRHPPYFWVAFLVLQTLTQLSSAFRRPPPQPGPAARVDWAKMSPLHSEHWGER